MQKPEACKTCPMYNRGEGYAPPRGPIDAKIYVVGEALGANEAAEGKPFVGGAGRVLGALLHSAGRNRDMVRLDNAMRCRPPGNKIPKDFDPVECARRHLFPALKEHKPNVILALGNTPLSVLAGVEKITKHRGSVLKTVHGKIVPTLHPAYLMRNQSMWAVVSADIKLAVKESLFSEVTTPKPKYNIFPTLADIREFRRKYDGQRLASDIETTWGQYWASALICIGFATKDEVICIPWLKQGGGFYWPPEEQEAVVGEIQGLLNNPLTFQNGFFDIQVLESFGFTVPNYAFDTLLAHHLLYAELPHDLGFITSVHTPFSYYKDESKSDTGALSISDTTFRTYNCNDAIATFYAAEDLKGDLVREGKDQHFRQITMKLPRVLLNMQKRGVAIDQAVLRRAIVEYHTDIEALEKKAESLSIPKGDKALKAYLFTDLALPILKRSKKTRQPSLDADTFERLHNWLVSQPTPNEKAILVLNTIQEKKKKQKILSTYLRGLPIAPDGRIHTRWLQHGTKNQRLSSRDPNLQNVPDGIAKRIYCAKPGHLLFSYDYSQIELRIIAYHANDIDLIRCFEAGEDIHDNVARDLFNIPKNEPVPKDKRRFTKCAEYCWNYGGDITAVLRIAPGVLGFAEAKRAQAEYFRKRPALAMYRANIEAQVKKTKCVVDPFGLKRIIFGQLSDNIRSAYNNPMQSGAAYIINRACVALHEEGLEEGLILQVHDALVFELPADTTRVEDIRNVMERPATIRGHSVKFPVDITYGPNWDDLKPWSAV